MILLVFVSNYDGDFKSEAYLCATLLDAMNKAVNVANKKQGENRDNNPCKTCSQTDCASYGENRYPNFEGWDDLFRKCNEFDYSMSMFDLDSASTVLVSAGLERSMELPLVQNIC